MFSLFCISFHGLLVEMSIAFFFLLFSLVHSPIIIGTRQQIMLALSSATGRGGRSDTARQQKFYEHSLPNVNIISCIKINQTNQTLIPLTNPAHCKKILEWKKNICSCNHCKAFFSYIFSVSKQGSSLILMYSLIQAKRNTHEHTTKSST